MNRLKEPDSDGGKIKSELGGGGHTSKRGLHETSSFLREGTKGRGPHENSRKEKEEEAAATLAAAAMKATKATTTTTGKLSYPPLPVVIVHTDMFHSRTSTHTDTPNTPTKIQKQEDTSATDPSYHHPSVVQLLLLYYCRATRR